MKIRWNLLASIAWWIASAAALHAVTVTAQPWGTDAAGDAVELYTLKDLNAEVQLTTYGARIVSIRVPDRSGQMSNVVLGFGTLNGYLDGRNPFMGATIGRFANRIAGGEFHLDGKTYEIPKNMTLRSRATLSSARPLGRIPSSNIFVAGSFCSRAPITASMPASVCPAVSLKAPDADAPPPAP